MAPFGGLDLKCMEGGSQSPTNPRPGLPRETGKGRGRDGRRTNGRGTLPRKRTGTGRREAQTPGTDGESLREDETQERQEGRGQRGNPAAADPTGGRIKPLERSRDPFHGRGVPAGVRRPFGTPGHGAGSSQAQEGKAASRDGGDFRRVTR